MRVAFSVDYVEWNMVGAKPIRILFVTIVKLADGFNAMTTVDEFMSPTPDGAIVWMGVIPVFNVVGVSPSCEAGASWHADRRRRVGGFEPGAIAGDRVDVGSTYDVIAIATCDMPGMLVRHYEKDV